MKNAKTISGTVRGVCLMLVALLSFLSFSPQASAATHVTPVGRPVIDVGMIGLKIEEYLQKLGDWIESLGALGKIIKGIKKVFSTIDEWMDKLNEEIKKATEVKTAGVEAVIATQTDIFQALADAGMEDSILEVILEQKMEHVNPRTDFVCHNVRGGQLPLTTEEFEEQVSTYAESVVREMYRGPKDDGAGVQYAVNENEARKKLGSASPVDGYDSDYVKSGVKGTDGRSFADADLSAFTLDGEQILEFPKVKQEKIGTRTFDVPDPQNDEQRFWTAGLYYCFNLAGPRPTPPVKEEIVTPAGIGARFKWETCVAAQTAVVKACVDLLAYYTRPNDTFTKMREEQKKKCDEIKGVDKDALGGCDKGLSPYFSSLLAQLMCKSHQHFISASVAGATDPELSESVDRCTTSWNVFAAVRAQKEAALAEAAGVLAKLSSCWPGTGRR